MLILKRAEAYITCDDDTKGDILLPLEDEGDDAAENVGTKTNNASEVTGKLKLEASDNGAGNGNQTVASSGESDNNTLESGVTADLDGELDGEFDFNEELGDQAGKFSLAVTRDATDSSEMSLGLADESNEDLDVLLDVGDGCSGCGAGDAVASSVDLSGVRVDVVSEDLEGTPDIDSCVEAERNIKRATGST